MNFRPCVVPEIRSNNKARPIIAYPGYVDRRHPAYTQTERRPSPVHHQNGSEIRRTSEHIQVTDNPPKVCNIAKETQQRTVSISNLY